MRENRAVGVGEEKRDVRGVNSPAMRNINRSIVLNLVRNHAPISRADIARRSQLAPSAVSSIVGELMRLGLIREGRVAESGGGRPATLLELGASFAYSVGVNVGLTNITAVAVDLEGRVVGRFVAPTLPPEGPASVLRRVSRAVEQVIAAAGLPHSKVAGVGVGVPGLVETRSGRSLFSPNLQWRDVGVREALEGPLGLPVYVDNDVRAATLGENEHGAGEGARNLVALFVGSAIGAGLVLDGRLYYGSSESAGEVGHVRVTDDGPLCSCGKYGCLEAVASGRAIARKAARLLKQGAPFTRLHEIGKPPDDVTAEDVSEAAAAGDPVAAQIMGEAARDVGLAVSFLVNTFNPERVVIGGGVSRAGEQLLGPIREMVQRHAMPIARDRVRIVQSRLGSDAGAIGAAALVMEKFFPSIHLAQSALLTQERAGGARGQEIEGRATTGA